MHVFEECRARHQLGIDFQLTTSPGDKMAVLSQRWGMNTRYWRMVTGERWKVSDLRSKIQDQDGIELVVNFCHPVLLKWLEDSRNSRG